MGHKCYCHSETSGQVPKEDLHCYNRPPPLQIVFIGDGCEAYSPGIFISAKTELTSISDKPGRQTFFIGFNGLYQANPFLGIWSKMDVDFISEEEAKSLAINLPKLEQLDMKQFEQTVKKLHQDSFQMPSFLILGVMSHQ